MAILNSYVELAEGIVQGQTTDQYYAAHLLESLGFKLLLRSLPRFCVNAPG